MYRVGVREHVMIAHSLKGETFGPAQKLHGATYVVDMVLSRPELDADGVVVDIALAHTALKAVLAPLAYQNLDELEQFAGCNTTTEFLARALFDALRDRIVAGEFGESGRGITKLEVRLNESHVAWASYEGPIPAS